MGKESWIKVNFSVLNNPKIGMLRADLWRLYIELRLLADKDGNLPTEADMTFCLHLDLASLTEKLKNLSLKGLVKWVGDDINGAWILPENPYFQGPFFASNYPDNWEDLRQDVLKRDCWHCIYCGDHATHVDHIIAVSRGGTHEPSNLVAACARCNHSKNDSDFMDWYTRQSCFDQDRANHIKSILASSRK